MTDGSCQYRRYIGRKRLILLLLCAFLAAVCILSLMTGSAGLSLADVIGALLQTGSRENSVIVWNVRMPRLVTAVTVGMALGLSGCIMQNVLCNPLASASTLGVSQGASFGAALAIVLMESGDGMSVSGPYAVSSAAFCGGMITTLVILLLSRLRESSSSMMVLAGVAISSMFTGGTTLLQYFGDETQIASAVDAGILGYEMYRRGGHQFVDGEGIVRKGVENTIGNVGRLAREGMRQTDEEILEIMVGQ